MPSPFPGMDPYLEAPAIWPDFHDAFAGAIRNELNQTLPAPYYARLEMRPEIGIAADDVSPRRAVPDVNVVRSPGTPSAVGTTQILAGPRRQVSSSYDLEVLDEPLRHHFVEIRDSAQGHKLVTLIEIASPSNKHRGPDRDAYLRKQTEILESDANLIEIDLLRTGDRLVSSPHILEFLWKLKPPPTHLVLVNRASKRSVRGTGYQAFPIHLREMLPCIPVPLRPGEPDVPLDLQYLFGLAYDGGPYRRGAVNYSAPASPPVEGDDGVWAVELLGTLRPAR